MKKFSISKRLIVFFLIVLFNCLLINSSIAQQQKIKCDNYVLYEENPFIYSMGVDSVKQIKGDDYFTIAFWNIEYWPGGMFEQPPKSTSVANQLVAVKHIIDREDPTILIAAEVYSYSSALFLNENLNEPYPNVAVTAYCMDNENSSNIKKYENLENQSSPPRSTAGRRHEHAIFSRLPAESIVEVEILETDVEQVQPRGFIVSKYIIEKNPLWIYGIHSSAGEKWEQFRSKIPILILCDMQKRNLNPQKDRIIICGDFNMNLHNSKESHFFDPFFNAGFFNAHNGVSYPERITKPTSGTPGIVEGGSSIDYMFVSQKLMVHLKHYKIIEDSAGARPAERVGRDTGIASDHRMLIIKLSK